MSKYSKNNDLSDAVLDRAFLWAVRLDSGLADEDDRCAFKQWLALGSQQQIAWRRVQAIEQEFAPARRVSSRGAHTLKRVSEKSSPAAVRFGGLGSVLSLLALVASLLWLSFPNTQDQDHYVTAVGEQRQINLVGGAYLYMNSDTVLDMQQHAESTRILLQRGEILVDSSAAQLTDKPKIQTSEGFFAPIGTRFVVSKKANATDLAVIEGHVAATPDPASISIEAIAGQRWRFAHGQGRKIRDTGLAPGAWVDGIIDAENARLGDVLDVLSAANRGWLRYDESAAALRVTGIFRLDDVGSALQALEQSHAISVQRRTGWWISVHGE